MYHLQLTALLAALVMRLVRSHERSEQSRKWYMVICKP
jgi:hypothetical protein